MSRKKPNYRKQGAGAGRGTYWQKYEASRKKVAASAPAETPAETPAFELVPPPRNTTTFDDSKSFQRAFPISQSLTQLYDNLTIWPKDDFARLDKEIDKLFNGKEAKELFGGKTTKQKVRYEFSRRLENRFMFQDPLEPAP